MTVIVYQNNRENLKDWIGILSYWFLYQKIQKQKTIEDSIYSNKHWAPKDQECLVFFQTSDIRVKIKSKIRWRLKFLDQEYFVYA